MTARFEQPGAKIPSTPEEVAAYLARRIERLTVEATAHLRIADTIAALRRERGTTAEGDDVLVRLEREARVAAEESWAAARAIEVDTTRAVDRSDADIATRNDAPVVALDGLVRSRVDVSGGGGGDGAWGDRYRSDHLVTPAPVK